MPMVKVAGAGNGPRHMCLHPNNRLAYVLSELASQISVYSYDAENGTLAAEALQVVSTLPPGVASGDGYSTTAAIRVTGDGRRLYGSNRGHDSIAEFAVDERSGLLQLLGHANTTPEGSANNAGAPRDFILLNHGEETVVLAANQNRDDIVEFVLDKGSNRLRRRGTAVTSPTPVALLPI